MNNIKSIGFALDPTNIPSFLLDWELTKLCNLDCSYCATGLEGGHDNSTAHPPIDECLRSIDFMYEYVDQYMKCKKESHLISILLSACKRIPSCLIKDPIGFLDQRYSLLLPFLSVYFVFQSPQGSLTIQHFLSRS